jgi:malonyl CoA-acyl carrier protein transacylase
MSLLDSPEALRSTVSVQLALLASGIAVARALIPEGVAPEAVAGMAAGAFAAAVAAGVLNVADGVRLMHVVVYQQHGNQVLGSYNDKREPTQVSEQFSYSRALPKYLPDFPVKPSKNVTVARVVETFEM